MLCLRCHLYHSESSFSELNSHKNDVKKITKFRGGGHNFHYPPPAYKMSLTQIWNKSNYKINEFCDKILIPLKDVLRKSIYIKI